MTILELKSSIVGKSLDNFYIFTGDEIGIMNIYMNQISKAMSLEVVRIDTVQEVYGSVKSKGLFINEPKLYVVRGDKDFQKEEKNWDTVINALGNNMLLLLYDKLDSRLKFGKYFKDGVVKFEPLDKPVLSKYILNQCPNLSSKNVDILINVCSGNYDVCMLECEKINTYKHSTEDRDGYMLSDAGCFKKLLEDGTIYQSQETDVFQFTDVVCKRDIQQSFELAGQLKDNGISAINSLGTLYNSMRSIMLIQCCSGDIANITGLDKGAIYYNKKRTGYYTVAELVRIVKLLATVIDDIKSGRINECYSIDYILVHIL